MKQIGTFMRKGNYAGGKFMGRLSFDNKSCMPEKGRPQIGYLCSYTPVEIIVAAGLQPIKLNTRDEAIKQADGYTHNTVCAYVRQILDIALEGGCSQLAGMIFVNSCDAMRRLYDLWCYYIQTGFTYIVELPRDSTEPKKAFYIKELKAFAEKLEEHFGAEITDSKLWESVRLVNQTRQLLLRLSHLREGNRYSLKASEVFSITMASTQSDLAKFNGELKGYLEKIREDLSREKKTQQPRVLLTGSVIDRTDIIELMEEFGLSIVAEDVCTGLRGLGQLAAETGDPWEALAEIYLERAPCARMKGLEHRLKFIHQLIDQYRVEGVISYSLKFCDPELMFYPFLKMDLEKEAIPHLHLEGDGTTASFGQLKTRIQAFIEMLTKA
jgi:benzoyl-CoA reductase/2-hydroxyglutaryl-CoA dehydratase subunit BcrC/BadD/HgdB